MRRRIRFVARLLLRSCAVVFVLAATCRAQSPFEPSIQWQRTLGGSNEDIPVVLLALPDGGFLVGATTGSTTNETKTALAFGEGDYWIVRLNADGSNVWDASFGGVGDERLSTVRALPDGGFLVAGKSKSPTSGNKTAPGIGGYDIWLVRTDSTGNRIWDETFGSTKNEEVVQVITNSVGGFAVLALQQATTFGPSDYYLVAVDAAGSKVWETVLGGDQDDIPRAIQPWDDGGFLLAGTSNSGISGNRTSANYGGYDAWLVRVGPNGVKIWDHAFGGTDYDSADFLFRSADGGWFFAGSSASPPSGTRTSPQWSPILRKDLWLVHVDAAGEKVWDRAYGGVAASAGGGSEQGVVSLHPANAGELYLGAYSALTPGGGKSGGDYGQEDFWTLRLDAGGELLWDRTTGSVDHDIAALVLALGDGGVITAGSSSSLSGLPSGSRTSPGYGGSDGWLVRYDSLGGERWQTSLGGANGEFVRMIVPTQDYGWLVLLSSFSPPSGNKVSPSYGDRDLWLVKLGPERAGLLLRAVVAGRGRVSVDPPPATDGTYAVGTMLTLTATSESGFSFAGWGGASSGTDNPASLAIGVDANSVLASFAVPGIPTLAVNRSGLDFAATTMQPVEATFEVWNTGGDRLRYLVTGNEPWVLVTPAVGDSVGQTNWHYVSLITSNLSAGLHQTKISVVPLDDSAALEITVSLLIVTTTTERSPSVAWQRGFGSSRSDILRGTAPLPEGGILLGGSSQSPVGGSKTSPNLGSFDYWIVGVDAHGTNLWDYSCGGVMDDRLSALAVTSTGCWLLGGNSVSPPNAPGQRTAPVPNYTASGWVICMATNGQRVWDAAFGVSGLPVQSFSLYSVAAWPDGDVLAGGSINVLGASVVDDCWVGRADPSGQTRWLTNFGGHLQDQLCSVVVLSSNEFVAAGWSAALPDTCEVTLNHGGADWWLMGMDGDGHRLWERSFGGSGADLLRCVKKLSDGGYLLVGDSQFSRGGAKSEPGFDEDDLWVMRVDQNWTKIWDHTFGGSSNDVVGAVTETADGGFLLGATTRSGVSGNKTTPNFGGQDYWVIALDRDGNKRWEFTLGGSGRDELYGIQVEPDGGLLVAGYSDSPISGLETVASYGGLDLWVARLQSPAPRLEVLPRSDSAETNRFQFVLVPAGAYGDWRIEYTTNWNSWIAIQTNLAVQDRVEITDENASRAGSRFYRAVRLP